MFFFAEQTMQEHHAFSCPDGGVTDLSLANLTAAFLETLAHTLSCIRQFHLADIAMFINVNGQLFGRAKRRNRFELAINGKDFGDLRTQQRRGQRKSPAPPCIRLLSHLTK